MKYSIRKQLTMGFVGLMAFILVLMFFVYSLFLERYYILHKENDLIEAYEITVRRQEMGETFHLLDNEEIWKQLEETNISMVIMNVTETQTVYSIRGNEEQLIGQLMGYLLNKNQSQGELLKATKEYEIRKTRDMKAGINYLELWGRYSDGEAFLLRSPLDSIGENASLANKLFLYIGIITILLGCIFMELIAKKVTEPISELAILSKKMSNLDFETKYTGGGENEIGVLGANFNAMSEQLERTISELKRANNQLQMDIKKKEKIEDMRNEFLGNVSHELKTPIALIQGYAEGLKEGVNDDPDSREFYCDVIIDEAAKMNQMVRNLLTLNQLEFGNYEMEFTRFDIIRLLEGVVQSCDILIQQAGAKAEFPHDKAVYVWADEFKTEQVIKNYLTNAIHHVDGEKKIKIEVILQGDTVRVCVFNSGSQIPQEDIGKLWDKFYKVDKAHTREYGGNGIGLSIVKAIMESFHQKYGVRNVPDGVEFWFELDCKTRETK